MLTSSRKAIIQLRRCAAAVLILAGAQPAQAEEIYRWVDENGVINYTQMKPRDVAAEQLSTRAGGARTVRDQAAVEPSAAEAASSAAAQAGPEGELSQTQQEMLEDLRAADQARKEEIARIRAANCQQSRKLLTQLSARGRIRVRDDDGGERMMDEAERQRRIDEAQRGIVENCAAS